MLTLIHLALLGASAFYGRFGTYPHPGIALDLLAAPAAFIAYTSSGTSISDLLVTIGGIIAILLMATATARHSQRERSVPLVAVGNVVLGSVLLWGLHSIPPRSESREHRFLFTEHSSPAVKYAFEFITPFDTNRVEAARPYAPKTPAAIAIPSVPRAHHVLLIVAECLRADHLPAFGYARNTTPFIQSEKNKWLVFMHAYAHGSRTADSFPVLFNSQYFAAIDRGNEGANAMWHFLRSAGVRTAFLSAGAMEWAGITHSLDLQDVDYKLIASDVPPSQQRKITLLPFDYAVDDGIPLRRYADLLAKEFSARQSFVTLHFVGSHFPFRYDDTPDVFLPSLRLPTSATDSTSQAVRQVQTYDSKASLTDASIGLVANSYDNSLVHVDRLVQQSVEILERLGIADDSVIIVTSDHGESLGEHQTFYHGNTLYEEQVHVPLLVRVGAHLAPVQSLLEPRLNHVVGEIDLMPTILHLLAGNAPNIKPFEGMSLLAGYVKPYELLLFRGIGEKLAFVTDDTKYSFDVLGRFAEEYSLANDPGERVDVWKGNERDADQFIKTVVKRLSTSTHRP